jgi:hypothetical protein
MSRCKSETLTPKPYTLCCAGGGGGARFSRAVGGVRVHQGVSQGQFRGTLKKKRPKP